MCLPFGIGGTALLGVPVVPPEITTQRIAVIGIGYVGATTAACMADLGHTVSVFDLDSTKMDAVRAGRAPIYEPGLDEIVARTTASGHLLAATTLAEAVSEADFVILCVQTPSLPDGSADQSFLETVSTQLAPLVRAGAVVVNKSTVPVGSTEVVAAKLDRSDVAVASNPEFLSEGTGVRDFMQPDRIVVGCKDPVIAQRVADLYRPLGDVEFVLTDPSSAELIKYASNAYLATRLSFVNAVAEVCEALGGDMAEVARGIGLDDRIGPRFLRPGPGWGGSCFPKDTRALVSMADSAGFEFRFLNAVIAANEQQFALVASRALEMLNRPLSDARIAVLGLAFKAGIDDVRNSPAVEIVHRLLAAGVHVAAHDPEAVADIDGLSQVATPSDAARDADLLLVLTEWPEYAELDPRHLASLMRQAALLDYRNVVDAAAFAKAGFTVRQVGRGVVAPD